MRILITWFAALVLLASCSKKATIIETEPPMLDSSGVITHTGNFADGPYGTVSGVARIVQQDSVKAVVLTNFMTSAGPDLHVYLSKQVQPLDFIDLGTLRSNTGEQAYTIPVSVSFDEYRYVLIHCQAFNHLFGSATLNMN